MLPKKFDFFLKSLAIISGNDDLTTSETLSNSKIVASVYESIYDDSESDDNEDENEEDVPKASENLSAIKTLSWCIKFHSDYSGILQDFITNIKKVIFTVSSYQRKQQIFF